MSPIERLLSGTELSDAIATILVIAALIVLLAVLCMGINKNEGPLETNDDEPGDPVNGERMDE